MIRIEILENERAFRDAVEERMEVSKWRTIMRKDDALLVDNYYWKMELWWAGNS
jgi:hypothetical protein